jgi:hypothetical protein
MSSAPLSVPHRNISPIERPIMALASSTWARSTLLAAQPIFCATRVSAEAARSLELSTPNDMKRASYLLFVLEVVKALISALSWGVTV